MNTAGAYNEDVDRRRERIRVHLQHHSSLAWPTAFFQRKTEKGGRPRKASIIALITRHVFLKKSGEQPTRNA